MDLWIYGFMDLWIYGFLVLTKSGICWHGECARFILRAVSRIFVIARCERLMNRSVNSGHVTSQAELLMESARAARAGSDNRRARKAYDLSADAGHGDALYGVGYEPTCEAIRRGFARVANH